MRNQEEANVAPSPVNDLPGVGQISHYLHRDEHFLFDIDGADHLMEELACVRQELTHLQVGLQLVKLLDLTGETMSCEIIAERHVTAHVQMCLYLHESLNELHSLPAGCGRVLVVQGLNLFGDLSEPGLKILWSNK